MPKKCEKGNAKKLSSTMGNSQKVKGYAQLLCPIKSKDNAQKFTSARQRYAVVMQKDRKQIERVTEMDIKKIF